jgi:hypothetical protein
MMTDAVDLARQFERVFAELGEASDPAEAGNDHGSPSPIAAGHGAWGRRRDQLGQPAVLRRPQPPAIHLLRYSQDIPAEGQQEPASGRTAS